MKKSAKNFLMVDVLPYEIPLLYSNKKLVEHIFNTINWDKFELELNDHTVPYQFYIWKSENSKRKLDLIHPFSQIQMLKFIEVYDQELIDFCNIYSVFSIRYPSSVNSAYSDNV